MLPVNKAGRSLGALHAILRPEYHLDHRVLQTLLTVVPILEDAAHTIMSMPLGVREPPLPSYAQLEDACKLSAQGVPSRLGEFVRNSLLSKHVSGQKLVAEIRAYVDPSRDARAVLIGILSLLGRDRGSLSKWEDIKKQFVPTLLREMASLGRVRRSHMQASVRATQGLDIDTLMRSSCPFPVRVLLKWLQATRLLYELQLQGDPETMISGTTSPG